MTGDPTADLDQLRAEAEALIGTTFAGLYEIEALITSGGTGTLYRATHSIILRTCALKILNANELPDGRMIRSFQREARTVSRLNHPNIIQVSAFGVEKNRPYIVMDFVEGESLSQALRREGPMKSDRARMILEQILTALTYAHSSGIIHRDLKPGNIMLVASPGDSVTVKLVDFGLAKTHEIAETHKLSSTTSGGVAGSPAYMSPEQCSGRKLDARSDIYSLGCLMYELLSGHPPHSGGTTYETMQKQTTEDAKPLSIVAPQLSVDAVLESSVLKALSKSPQDRFQAAAEWARFLEDEKPTPIPLTSAQRQGLWRRAAIVSILVGGVAILILALHQTTVRTDSASNSSIPGQSQAHPKAVEEILGPLHVQALASKVDELHNDGINMKDEVRRRALFESIDRYLERWLASNKDPKGIVRFRYHEILKDLHKEKESLRVLMSIIREENQSTNEPTNDRGYVTIVLAAARAAQTLGKFEQSEKLLNSLLDKADSSTLDVMSIEIEPRLALAEVYTRRKQYRRALIHIKETDKMLERELETPHKGILAIALRGKCQYALLLEGMAHYAESAKVRTEQRELIQTYSKCQQWSFNEALESASCLDAAINLYVVAGQTKKAVPLAKELLVSQEMQKLPEFEQFAVSAHTALALDELQTNATSADSSINNIFQLLSPRQARLEKQTNSLRYRALLVLEANSKLKKNFKAELSSLLNSQGPSQPAAI